MGVSMDTVWMKLYRKELKVKSSNKERNNVIEGTTKNQYTKILENIVGLQVTSYKKKKKKKQTKQHINIESKTRAKVNLILLTSNIIFLTTKNNTKKKKISNFFKKKKKKKKKKK